jgi:hypothetical protein
MKPARLFFLILFLLLLGATAALAEEPLLYGGRHLSPGGASGLAPGLNQSDAATWLTFRYDTAKEATVSLPGQKEFQAWLAEGRCAWISGLNIAAGYQIWSPKLDHLSEIYTTRAGLSYTLDGLNLRNKAAEISLERSTFSDPTKEPSYGAIAAFTMQF